MAAASPIEMKRHYHQLSPKQIDELAAVVADLIVDFLKKRRDPVQSDNPKPEQEVLALPYQPYSRDAVPIAAFLWTRRF